MPVSTLAEMARRVCIKNVRNLTDVGSIEYFLIKDVLAQVKHSDQLRQIELNSPQILGEDAELWQKLIARDIPDWYKKNYAPKNPKKWYEVYCKYKREQAAEIKRDEDKLRQQMMGLQKTRETNVSRVVDLKQLPKIPRDPRMLANNGGVPLTKKGFKKDAPSSLVFSSGSKTKLVNGNSVLTRARREAKEIAQMSKLSRPTHQLAGKLGQVTKAPEGMVKAYKTASQPVGRSGPSIKILSRKPALNKALGGSSTASASALEERENRLRALTGSKTAPSATQVTYLGSSDDEDLDDLFDEPSSSRSSSPSSLSKPALPTPPSKTTSRPIAKPLSTTQKLSKPRPMSTVTHTPPVTKSSSPANHASSAPSRPPPSSLNTESASSTFIKKRKPVDIFNRGAKKPRV